MPITATAIAAARQRLFAAGINVAALCREHGVSHQAAKDILSGRSQGHRGEAHRAAILLGLKPDPKTIETEA